MGQVLAIIQAVLSLLPLVVELIKKIETLFPQSGQGAAKLDMVKDALSAAYTAGGGENAPVFTAVWNVISGLISKIVALFNATGAFTTSTK